MGPRITVLVFLLCLPAAFSALDSGPPDATSIQKPPSRGRRSVDSEEMLDDATEEMFNEKDIYRLAETGR